MQIEERMMENQMVRFVSVDTVIVGTGASGYNAANQLWQLGVRDVVMVSERKHAGTSRNTGSDKQTYYKLSTCGGNADSIMEMAEDYFRCGAMDGEHALCEAALSLRCFFNLVELGVPFPADRYGQYVGYQTDHACNLRATSAGPYTSKMMTECLEKAAAERGIPVMDHLRMVKILKDRDRASGIICLETGKRTGYTVFQCRDLIMATGGPAEIYEASVFPASQTGATGVMLLAGATGKNLTEWQYGMCSLSPRWNVSGTYMQAMPRIYSTDAHGLDEREFILEAIGSPEETNSLIFLKGYQWPFDAKKIRGSSLIDLLIYQEIYGKGRKVYLDYRKNLLDRPINFQQLSGEAYEYLSKADAQMETPYLRLERMNRPAVDFYRDHHVDLEKEPLEISVCAQHNNGGISVDAWWQSNIKGLFVVGEAAGTHGICRPGGSALNAGQVGSLRAAMYIAAKSEQKKEKLASFMAASLDDVKEEIAWGRRLMENRENAKDGENTHDAGNANDKDFAGHVHSARAVTTFCRRMMSKAGGMLRDQKTMEEYLKTVSQLREHFLERIAIRDEKELNSAYMLKDILVCQEAYLTAMLDYWQHGGKSRGSACYVEEAGEMAHRSLPAGYRFSVDQGEYNHMVQEIVWDGSKYQPSWRKVHELPSCNAMFEVVWKEYREHRKV